MAHSSKNESKQELKTSFEDALRPSILTRSSPTFNTLSQPEVFRSFSSASLDAPLYRSSESELAMPSFPKSQQTSSHSYHGQKSLGLDSQLKSYASEKETSLEPPTAPGGYLEPSYHFITRVKPTSLLQAIVIVVQANGIDFQVNSKKYKVKCVIYPVGEPKVPFVASVFQMNSDKQGKRYAVELQRRSGDVIHFSDFWTTLRRYFVEKGMLDKAKDKEVPKKMVVPKLDDVMVTDAQIKETLKCLLQMASSSCCDVKSQAIAALSKMSTQVQVQKLMIEEACLDAFMDAASSKMEDIHRCAVHALANLAQHDSICRLIVEKGGVRVLCSLSHSDANQVVRDCSRALGSIAITLGSSVVDDEFRETLMTLRCSPDPFTQQAARQLEELHL